MIFTVFTLVCFCLLNLWISAAYKLHLQSIVFAVCEIDYPQNIIY